MKKIWGIMAYLSRNQWSPITDEISWADDFGDYLIDQCEKNGMNAILLDVGDGVQYSRHPELALKNSWSAERVHEEVQKCRAKGIELIPKVNFSTDHAFWLKDYYRMTSSSIYYKVCHDIIEEIYELFEQPKYIHIGMDEENYSMLQKFDYVVLRKGELLMHDLKFLIDEVNALGAKPLMWADVFLSNPESFVAHIPVDDVILMPWYYHAFKREHSTPVKVWWEILGMENQVNYMEHPEYKQGRRFIEDRPEHVRFRETAAPYMKYGYKYIPTPSVWGRNDYNTEELVEYFRDGAPSDDQIVGFITAPWGRIASLEAKERYDKSIRLLREAREKLYPEEK